MILQINEVLGDDPMKKQKKNFYAIYYIGTGENTIVKTWAECQKKTKGRANKFKGFITEDEARKWLAEIDPKKAAAQQKQAERSKEAKKSPTAKVPFSIKLERKAVADLRKKAETFNMPVEFLVENLILEYLYDE